MSGQTSKRCPSPHHIGERELPLDSFHLCAGKKDGRKSHCKACIAERHRRDPSRGNARSRAWNRRNVDALRERRKVTYWANPEPARQASREWARANPDRARERHRAWVARNPERVREYNKQHAKRNRSDKRAALIRYRAKKREAGGTATVAQLQWRWEYFAGRCWICRGPACEWDHVKPVSKGGGSWASNLRPCCRSCNVRKRDRWPFP